MSNSVSKCASQNFHISRDTLYNIGAFRNVIPSMCSADEIELFFKIVTLGINAALTALR